MPRAWEEVHLLLGGIAFSTVYTCLHPGKTCRQSLGLLGIYVTCFSKYVRGRGVQGDNENMAIRGKYFVFFMCQTPY